MKGMMSRQTRKQLKVFYTIIKRVLIDMVNYLLWFKETTKTFLHNKALFPNISLVIFKWMVGTKNKTVAMLNVFPALPSRIIFAFEARSPYTGLANGLSMSFRKLATLSGFAHFFSGFLGMFKAFLKPSAASIKLLMSGLISFNSFRHDSYYNTMTLESQYNHF